MTNEELYKLDRLAAEKVMGWTLINTDPNTSGLMYSDWYANTSPTNYSLYAWQPTRNIAQAWELLEKLSKDYTYTIDAQFSGEIICTLHKLPILPLNKYIALEETAPLAITKACLKAVGEYIE